MEREIEHTHFECGMFEATINFSCIHYDFFFFSFRIRNSENKKGPKNGSMQVSEVLRILQSHPQAAKWRKKMKCVILKSFEFWTYSFILFQALSCFNTKISDLRIGIFSKNQREKTHKSFVIKLYVIIWISFAIEIISWTIIFV